MAPHTSSYSPAAQKILSDTMREFSKGKLKSGKSRSVVKQRDQAVAIGISKARDKGLKVPNEK